VGNKAFGKCLLVQGPENLSPKGLHHLLGNQSDPALRTVEALAVRICFSSPTHPVLAVAELMRLLVDRYGHVFEKAWDITSLIFSYTNHSLLPEILETWDIDML
jgi:hypothetical protein